MDFRSWNQNRTETYHAADTGRKIYERDTEAEDCNWSLQVAGLYQLGNYRLEMGGETKRYGWGAQDVSYIDTSYFNGSINFWPACGSILLMSGNIMIGIKSFL